VVHVWDVQPLCRKLTKKLDKLHVPVEATAYEPLATLSCRGNVVLQRPRKEFLPSGVPVDQSVSGLVFVVSSL